jgi:competence protein ComEC
VLSGILLLFVWSLFQWRRLWIPCSGIAALLGCLAIGSVPGLGRLLEETGSAVGDRNNKTWKRDDAILSLTFLDVGEGDAIVLRFPDRRIWILDAGGIRQSQSVEDSAYAFDIGEAVVSRYLWHFWTRRIDRMVLSHPDIDHAGGFPAVMRNFAFNGFDYARAAPDRTIDGLVDFARSRNAPIGQLHAGMEERVGKASVRILNPPAGATFSTTNENSLVLQISLKRFAALLAGDLEKRGEDEVLSQPGLSACQLLKVAHHGSRSGTTDLLLDRIRPRWGIISVGRNNPFGHPSGETLGRLLRHGVRTFSTVDDGALSFETDGERYVLKSHIHGVLERGIL